MFFALLYLFIGFLLAFAAYLRLWRLPPHILWLGAAAFLLVGLWRVYHLLKGAG